jgi:Tol biopolymer transport system component
MVVVAALLGKPAVAPDALHAAEPQQLTHDGRYKKDLVFIDGGQSLVYSVAENPSLMRLVRLRLGDGVVEPLHSQAATSEFEAAFSPDGRYCAFVQLRNVTNVQLAIRDYQTGKDALFDPGGGRAHLGCPSIAPDAKRVLFSYPTSGGQQIVSVDIEARDRRNLTETSGINNWGTFSPDGTQIAFGSSREGDFDIYLMNSDGSNVRRLTREPGRDLRPAWSPDGKRLAFTSARDGNSEIYMMGVDGSKPMRLTNHPERDDYAAWHPDGRQLALIAERSGEFDVYLLSVPTE